MPGKISYKVEYSEKAVHDLKSSDIQDSGRIRKKVRFFAHQENPLIFCEPLKGLNNRFRWRVGKWRIIFEKHPESNTLTILWILAIEKRDKVYSKIK